MELASQIIAACRILSKANLRIPACRILLFIFTLAGSSTAAAQDAGFGIGIILGEPTGISVKNWVSGTRAVDFAAAWSLKGENSLTLHADLLLHNYTLARIEKGALPFFFGIGGRVEFQNDEVAVGARIPVGFGYQFEDIALDAFFEIVPILHLLPATDFDMSAAVGMRYFFR